MIRQMVVAASVAMLRDLVRMDLMSQSIGCRNARFGECPGTLFRLHQPTRRVQRSVRTVGWGSWLAEDLSVSHGDPIRLFLFRSSSVPLHRLPAGYPDGASLGYSLTTLVLPSGKAVMERLFERIMILCGLEHRIYVFRWRTGLDGVRCSKNVSAILAKNIDVPFHFLDHLLDRSKGQC